MGIILLIIISIILVYFAFIAFYKDKKNYTSLNFLLFVVFFVGWIWVNYLSNVTKSYSISLLMNSLIFSFTSIAIYFLFLFSLNYPNREFKTRKSFFIPYTAIGLIVIILSGTRYLVKDITIEEGYSVVEFGNFIIAYALFVLLSAIASVIILLKKYRRSRGIEKVRIQYLALGFFFTLLGAIITNLILPLVFGVFDFSNIGPLFSIFLVGFTSYSIIRYRLLGIKVILGNMITLFLIGVFTYVTFYTVVLLEENFLESVLSNQALGINVFLALVYSGGFIYLYRLIKEKIQESIIYSEYDPSIELEKFNKELSSKIKLEEIVEAFKLLVSHTVKSGDIAIYLKDSDSEKYVEFTTKSKFVISSTELNQIHKLRDFGNSILKEEVLEGWNLRDKVVLEFKNFFKNSKYSLFLPFYEGKVITGFAVLAGDFYDFVDINFLETAIKIINISIGRAKYFREYESLILTLEDRILEATEELRVKNIQLDTALRKEKDMMDVLGHELRTPLGNARNAVLMMEDLKATNKLTDELYDKYIKIAIENIRREKDLIQTILQSARLENDRFQITKVKFDAAKLMESAETSFKSQAEAKGLKFEIEYPKQEVLIYNDQTVLQQILDNFMTNAIKYTYEGSIKVALEDLGEKIRISVKDTGEGLKKEDLQHIGKKFFRANTHLESQGTINGEKIIRPGGTGIGLYVVKGILKNLGSDLKIDSEFGKGSTFSFEIKKDLNLVGKEQPTQAPTTNSLGELAVEPSSIAEVNRKVLESQKEVIKPIAKPKLNTKLGK
jgi:signal transduction histidine kinase